MATATKTETARNTVGMMKFEVGQSYTIPVNFTKELEGFNARDVSPAMVDEMAESVLKLGQIANVTVFLPDSEDGLFAIETGHTRRQAILKLTREGKKIHGLWSDELETNQIRVTIASPPPRGVAREQHAFLRNIAENEHHNGMSPRDKALAVVRAQAFEPPISNDRLAMHLRLSGPSEVSRIKRIANLVPVLQNLIHIKVMPASAVWLSDLDKLSEEIQGKLGTWILTETDMDPVTLKPNKAGNQDKSLAKISMKAIHDFVVKETSTPAAQKPVIVDFVITGGKAKGLVGEKRGLKWEVTGAEKMTLNGLDVPAGKGEIAVTIDADATKNKYELIATNANGEAKQNRVFTIEVTAASTPLTQSSEPRDDDPPFEGDKGDSASDHLDQNNRVNNCPSGGTRCSSETILTINDWIAKLTAGAAAVHVSNPVSRSLRLLEKFLAGTSDANQVALELNTLAVETAGGYTAPVVKKGSKAAA